MAVTGVFAADFSAFDKAVEGSQAKLAGFEQAGQKVESSLRLMTQSQEQLLDKVGAAGGRIQDIGTKAAGTDTQVKTLSESYRQFDGVLQAAGINIGPQIKGLDDIASAAGKTATELGALGTAGLAVGAAMTGWKIGSVINDMTGLSDAVANLTSNLLGYGDIMTDQQGRQMVINKAVEEGGTHIRSYADAVKYLDGITEKNRDTQINWRDRLADAHREVRNLTEAQREGIAIAQEAGATTEQITNKYGISSTALEILAGRQRDAAAATEEHTRKSEALARAKEAEAAALEKAYNKLMSDTKNQNQLAIMNADAAKMEEARTAAQWKSTEAFKAGVAAVVESTNAAAAYATEQEALTAANDQLWQSVDQTTSAHLAAGEAAEMGTQQTVAGYQAVAQQVEVTSDGVRGWLELMRATNAANALLNQNSLFTTGSTLENQARIGTAFSPIPGVGTFGAPVANLPAGSSAGNGSSLQMSNTFNLTDTESNLARRVSEMIMRSVRAGTQLGTA